MNSTGISQRRPLRLGVVGAGSVAELHLEAAAGLPEVRVAAICDVRPQAAQRLADRYGARAHPGHEAMFAEGGLDAVVVTVPHSLHAPISVEAAALGLHVLVEKPMATTVADCLTMIEACATHGVCLAVGHMMRHLPAVGEAGRILRSGELGAPVLINERRTARYDPGSRPEWFFDPRRAGGGIVMNVGSHSIDKVQWLADGMVDAVFGHVASTPGLAVETECAGLLELTNGVRVSLSVTGTGLPFQDETEVVCEAGALRLSRRDGLWSHRGDEAVQLVTPGADDAVTAFREQLADFAARCRDGGEPTVGGEYGRGVVATVLALYASAQRGDKVRITDIAEEVVA